MYPRMPCENLLHYTTVAQRNVAAALRRVKLLSKRVRFSCLLQQNVTWMKRFMKQIKRLKSLLEKFAAEPRECATVRVYKMADGADGKSQMYVLFCYFA